MRLESELRFLEERQIGVSIVCTVGWAKALALYFHIGRAYRAQCPPSASMQDPPPPVGTAHENALVVERQCHRLCPPYGACIGLAAVLLLTTPARADDVADFYRGKTVTIIVSAGAGGGYDTLARTVARFLNKHLPGNPIFVVRNMAGGGGLAAANALFSGAEKDGTQIGLLQSNSPFDPLLGTREARFDATKFNWLGTPSVETGLFVLSNAVPVETLADARVREITVGAAGANSAPAFHARLFNDVLGLKLKIKTGHPALTDAVYGLEHGDVEGEHT